MTTTITVRACTLAELAAAYPELDWTPVLHPAGARAGEPVKASELAALDRAASRAVRATLPAQPGVYVWTTRGMAALPDTVPSQEAVVYLGLAASRGGLADRLASELRYVWNTRAHGPQYLQRWYHGHPRAMLELDAHALYAVTDDAATARRIEQELLAVTVYVAGLTPWVNGSAWLSDSADQKAARAEAWKRAEAAGLLHDEPTL